MRQIENEEFLKNFPEKKQACGETCLLDVLPWGQVIPTGLAPGQAGLKITQLRKPFLLLP